MQRNKLIPGAPEIFLDCYLKTCRHNSFSSVTYEARNSRKNKHRLLSYSICLSFCPLFSVKFSSIECQLHENKQAQFYSQFPTLTYQTCYSRAGYFLNPLVYARDKCQVIPPVELIATTGAGDSFIGAVLYIVSLHCPVSNQNQKESAPNLNKWSQG